MSASELVPFLTDSKANVRAIAVEHIKALTATPEGINELSKSDVVKPLTQLIGDQLNIAKDAITALINLCENADLMAQVNYFVNKNFNLQASFQAFLITVRTLNVQRIITPNIM